MAVSVMIFKFGAQSYDRYIHANLFTGLSQGRFGRRFTWFTLAAGKFINTRHGATRRANADQEFVATANDGDGDLSG